MFTMTAFYIVPQTLRCLSIISAVISNLFLVMTQIENNMCTAHYSSLELTSQEVPAAPCKQCTAILGTEGMTELSAPVTCVLYCRGTWLTNSDFQF